ncbi:MAG: hypothetical protein GWP67_09540 [Gammaproteobacteria bacterium]|jgi:hypothetical protein|nr:hypothetical protein [Gammaproteobacteria bacterium]
MFRKVLLAVILIAGSVVACAMPAPKTIDELRATPRDVTLKFERDIAGGPGFRASLYSYRSAGLKVHAMIARPNVSVPDGGFTEGMLESAYYTEDVLNPIAGLHDIEGINHEALFMMGHSMGGEVTFRT